MNTLLTLTHTACLNAFETAFPEIDPTNVSVTQSTQASFGDYQCNSAMRYAKPLKQAPRAIAEAVAHRLAENSLFSKVEVAGPGFINLTLNTDTLSESLNVLMKDPHLGCQQAKPQRIIVDFSSPNIAKEMHVGHLRSTIIGDAIARVLEFLGNDVLRLNHVGDWGTAFGMLITYLKDKHPGVLSGEEATDLSHLVTWYKMSKKCFDEDLHFKKRSQQQVVSLQSGEGDAHKAWKIICQISREAFQAIYDTLDITLIERGESSYNSRLQPMVTDLKKRHLLTESEGAQCIFLEGFKNKEDQPLPFMVQKSDGGFNYSSTDLAAITQRINEEKAKRIIYVTDLGQALHFKMVFAAAEYVGILDPKDVSAEHAGFGLVLGPDGRKYKTRSGETERLADLLTEAIKRARAILAERYPEWPESELTAAAHTLGIGALKYADLSTNRMNDYRFSYDKMLKFEGNTAAFILYAYVRAQSIQRKVNIVAGDICLQHDSERALGLHLRRFPETVALVSRDLMPNYLTDYLFELAQKFNHFFRDCHVEGAEEAPSRIALCQLTSTILHTGLSLLGINTLEKM